ncbi:hypothetical protein MRX96_043555 [Rhipicephalus microplus]
MRPPKTTPREFDGLALQRASLENIGLLLGAAEPVCEERVVHGESDYITVTATYLGSLDEEVLAFGEKRDQGHSGLLGDIPLGMVQDVSVHLK